MAYKQGKLIETYDISGKKKVTLSRINTGYRVTLFKKKSNTVWAVDKQKNTQLKKYAERRMVELLQEISKKA